MVGLAVLLSAAISGWRLSHPRIAPLTTVSGRRLTGFCAAAVQLHCDKRIECGQMERAQRAACIDEMGAECERAFGWKLTAGVVTVDSEPQEECLEGMHEAGCNALAFMLGDDEPGLFEITDRCELAELFHARSGLGGPCAETSDCTTGFCPGLAPECHRCREYASVGAACRPGEMECDPTRAFCSGAGAAMVCRPLGADGASCANANECRSGRCRANSDGTRSCAAGAAGASCGDASDCATGFYCRAESGRRVCAPRVKTGDPCVDEPLVCAEAEASCVGAHCRVRPFSSSRNAECRELSDCKNGLYCEGTAGGTRKGRCVPQVADGGACERLDFGACRIDSRCLAGHCRRLAAVGERCGGPYQCTAFVSCVPRVGDHGPGEAVGTCVRNATVGQMCNPYLSCVASFCDATTSRCVALKAGSARCQLSTECESQWCIPGALVCYSPCAAGAIRGS
ncbi:MAG: uncharacterized protein JWN44_4542 [Myxococcales bacterium]|nr:uncharacterized protein [Myxococcales bacterium]